MFVIPTQPETATFVGILSYVPLGGGLPAVSMLGPILGAIFTFLAAGFFFFSNLIRQTFRRILSLFTKDRTAEARSALAASSVQEENEEGLSKDEEEKIRKRLEGLGYIE